MALVIGLLPIDAGAAHAGAAAGPTRPQMRIAGALPVSRAGVSGGPSGGGNLGAVYVDNFGQTTVGISATSSIAGAQSIPLLGAIAPGTFSSAPVLLASGVYTVTARQPQSSAVVASASVTVPAGGDVTWALGAGAGGAPALAQFANDIAGVPATQTRLTVRDVAAGRGLDVYIDGGLVARGLTAGSTSPDLQVMPGANHNILVVRRGAAPKIENAVVVGAIPQAFPSAFEQVFVGNGGASLVSTLQGYQLAAADSAAFDYGSYPFEGSLAGTHLNAAVVGAAGTHDGHGYYEVSRDGGVFAFGDAAFAGSLGGRRLNAPIVGMATDPVTGGYWLVASDGGVFAFGGAPFYGSVTARPATAPIVGMTFDPQNGGYWVAGSDGSVYAFGPSSPAYGSMVGTRLAAPIKAISATADGGGYWLVAADGGVFAFGDAEFFGSTGGLPLNSPVVTLVPAFDSLGYDLVAADGGVFAFGDDAFYGSTGGRRLNAPVVTAFQ
jgi:hypothetical protein